MLFSFKIIYHTITNLIGYPALENLLLIWYFLWYLIFIFLEFAIFSLPGTYWLCGKLQFLRYHSPIKVKYLGTFSGWFQL